MQCNPAYTPTALSDLKPTKREVTLWYTISKLSTINTQMQTWTAEARIPPLTYQFHSVLPFIRHGLALFRDCPVQIPWLAHLLSALAGRAQIYLQAAWNVHKDTSDRVRSFCTEEFEEICKLQPKNPRTRVAADKIKGIWWPQVRKTASSRCNTHIFSSGFLYGTVQLLPNIYFCQHLQAMSVT